MVTSEPRFGAAVVAGLAFLASWATTANAQFGSVSPRQAALVSGIAPYGYPPPGYGYGAYLYPYGAGYYPFLANPYAGYLAGAADITTANGNYHKTIQEARLLREQANRSAIETRRRFLEQAQWERDEWLKRHDPEVVRQQDQAWELNRARHDPPLAEILSGRALNSLLTHLAKQQYRGERGPRIPLSEDVLKGINLSTGETRANAGLLKYDGRLQWPGPLEGHEFDASREHVSKLIVAAVNQAKNAEPVDAGKIQDLRVELGRMDNILVNNVSGMSGATDLLSPSEYIEAKRYLNLMGAAVKALEHPNAANYFNQTWAAKGANVAELVRYMTDKGLVFAPAVPGDADCYRALYQALQAFDTGMNSPAVAANVTAEPR
jgi:hypothetical protein